MQTNLPAVTKSARGTWVALAAGCLAASIGALAAAVPDIDLKIEVSLAPGPVKAGSKSEAVVKLTPPSGIHINQYPPIRLTFESVPPVIFEPDSYKIGLDAMPDPPEKNPFKTVDPIKVRFRVAAHAADAKVAVKGKLKFFYCVAASGYCAPGTKEVAFSVPVAAGP
jgi:hypothetical protein